MNPAVLFLEPKGTVLEVIRAAKNRNYSVIVFSSDPALLSSAPEPYRSALSCIDEKHHVVSWSDENAILKSVEALSNGYEIKGVYTGVDPCTSITAMLRKKFGLPTSSPEALNLVLNKFELRKRLYELGFSKLKNFHGSDVDSWSDWKLNNAGYFKPIHGFFSAYVKKCENLVDLQDARAAWKKGVDSEPPFIRDYLLSLNEYHLEESIDGELMSVEGLSSNGDYQCIGLLSRILYSKNPVVEMGSCFPYPHPLSEKIVKLVRDAHSALGLTDGPTHTEVIVSPDGEVEIIDLNPRFVGADVLQSINHAYNIQIEESLLNYALGEKTNVIPKATKHSCLQYVLAPEVPTFKSIEFPKADELKFQTSFLKSGAVLETRDRQLDYIGCYLTVTPTFKGSLLKSQELRSAVKINGVFAGVY